MNDEQALNRRVALPFLVVSADLTQLDVRTLLALGISEL